MTEVAKSQSAKPNLGDYPEIREWAGRVIARIYREQLQGKVQ